MAQDPRKLSQAEEDRQTIERASAKRPVDPDKMTREELIDALRTQQAAARMAQVELDRVRATSEAALLQMSNVIEVFDSKRTVKRETSKGNFEEVEVDFWKYTLDLPASAGDGLHINGIPAYHGQTITVDTDTLRTVKDMVARAWYHEQSIFGQANDNAFRQGYATNGSRVNTTLSVRGGRGNWAANRT